MAMPRKVIALSTAKIGKEKTMNRKRQEEELKIDRLAIENGPPEWLDETAAAEFMRVVHEAGKLPLFDNLDLSVLAVYAQNYSVFVEASTQLQKYGLVVKANGMPMPSPYVNVADKAAAKILQCSSKLGLAVTDRLKLIVPDKGEVKNDVNKYLKYLPGRA